MANKNRPISFKIINQEKYKPSKEFVDASYAGKDGDVVFMDSSGRATDTASSVILGIQVGGIESVATRVVETTGSTTAEESQISIVKDPGVVFKGQISTYTQTDPYTTNTSASCYDVAGSAGAQYINAAASTYDHVQVIEISDEWDTGKKSAIGAYAKALFRFNPASHVFGADS